MHSHHPIVAKITALLKEHGSVFETFEHAPVRTSEEAAALRPDYTLAQGAKALIVRVKTDDNNKRFVMLVLPADRRFDAEKVKRLLSAKDIRFATETEVGEITGGVLPGGIPPFGGLFNLPLYADETLFLNETIVFNAGDRSYSIAMRSQDYRAIAQPTMAGISVSPT